MSDKQNGELYSGFDPDQIAEIKAGLDAGLAVSVYAKKEFMAIQMFQIRLGLSDGLDVEEYARTEYDWFQMEEIRKGMLAGIDYKLYASPKLDYQRMRQIRKGLQDGIDLSGFARLDAGILRELRKSIKSKTGLVEYIKEGYEVEQLEQIRLALEKKLNVRPYLVKEFRGAAIREICNGLELGLDPSVYAKMEYGWQQMREIRLGMEHRVDINQYANSMYGWQQMREIRLGLEDGLDVSSYRSFMYTANDMNRIRTRLMTETLDNILCDKHEAVQKHNIMAAISIDEMEAVIEIKAEGNADITREDILSILREEGVTHGILEDEITGIIEEKKYNKTIVVAKGRHPVTGENGRYEYFFQTQIDRSPKILEDGSADYQDIRWYELVEEGQKIAYYHEAKQGIEGYTVTGRVLKAKKGKEQNVLSGKGFTLLADGKTYIAALSGKIELLSNRIEISRLIVLEEVNLATGNVNFDGCVYVRGNVGSGSVIYATEDVVVNGSVESAVIKCGGEILLRQGANGAGNGLIEAGKKVTGKFFEAIRVNAQEDIQANYCLNCDIYTGGQLIINGTKGILAGGTVQAIKGLKVCNVGNRARISTIIKMGVDDKILQNKKSMEKKIAEINKELAILGHAYMDFQRKYPPEVRNVMDMYLKIESAIYTKELELDQIHQEDRKLEKMIANMEGARAVITGSLNEGTTIIIDNIWWKAFDVRDVVVKRVGNKIMAYAD